jgi:hypothetical protein
MANQDKPRGFTPVKHTSGAPWTGQIRSIGVTDAADMFIGDALNLASGLAAVAATNDSALLGVAVGFGKKSDMTNQVGGAYNPSDLTTIYYDDSANTHTDWVVFYVPFNDMVFEVQTAVDLSASGVGATVDLLATAGSTTTGRSNQEVTTSTNADFIIVERPDYPDNDATLVNERLYVQAVTAETAFK